MSRLKEKISYATLCRFSVDPPKKKEKSYGGEKASCALFLRQIFFSSRLSFFPNVFSCSVASEWLSHIIFVSASIFFAKLIFSLFGGVIEDSNRNATEFKRQ
jgi:hypothetical protein